MSIGQVQKWVLSVLATTTILHLSGGFFVAAWSVGDDRAARIGITVVAVATWAMGIAVGLGIHGKRILSGWLLLGWAPSFLIAWYLLSA